MFQEISGNLQKQEQVNSLSHKQYLSIIIKKTQSFFVKHLKNNLIINIILETYKDFNIFFIQEPSQLFIHSISSLSDKNGNKLIRAPNYPDWLIFSRLFSANEDHSQVISYINVHFSYLQFVLYKDIFNHKDISCFFFFNNSNIFFIINVYSYNHQFALKYLKDTEVNIHNILIIASNFNIRDSIWNIFFLFHSSHSDFLFEITNSFDIFLSLYFQQVPM